MFDGVVLYEDDHLLALEKPAGLLAVPGRGPEKGDCLATRAIGRWPDALVVHRLDQATSGLMLLARGADMQRRLSAAFAERQIHKRYIAVVHGLPIARQSDDGWSEINLPMMADWPRRPRSKIDLENGKPSQTRWRVLARDEADQRARLMLEPVTGRSHQLRVHLQALGHPIVGDALYGHEDDSERLMLHACELKLSHPESGVELHFVSQVPF
ncbi:MAG: RluA family pseudouridine synthase [Comamonadaceae bacterium]|nr:RluA family pseudouridine synthase [Comamonadaceae bacterium]